MEILDRYTFGDFTLDPGERRLLQGDRPVSLPPKVFDVLVALVHRAGRLVTKRELLDAVWPDAFVEEGILAVHVSSLRKALHDTAQPPRIIETVRRSGYRFVAAPTRVPRPGRSSAGSGDRLIGLTDALTDRARAEVYELCGLGRSRLHTASLFEVPRAIEAFTAALEIDASYAPAHAGLALAHCAQAAMRLVPPANAYADAKVAALRALAMDESSADAQVALGTVLFFSEWDWRGAERSLRRALEINPSHQQGCVIYGRLLDACGRPQDALAIKLRALEVDPLSPLVYVQIALSYWNQRKFDEAIAWADKALAIDDRHLLAREFLVGAYQQKGDHDRAMAEAFRHAGSFGVSADALRPLKDAYESGGRPAVVRYTLEQARRHSLPALQRAALSAESGALDDAFEYLDQAIDVRDPALVDLAIAPQWDVLRSDPRFERCLGRMGLPQARSVRSG
jgi:DNA-binding winged helix-turn-helix (wHTH) protein/tetratricopeptide (TPR) repeat protein